LPSVASKNAAAAAAAGICHQRADTSPARGFIFPIRLPRRCCCC
jgi:hypothetical protein